MTKTFKTISEIKRHFFPNTKFCYRCDSPSQKLYKCDKCKKEYCDICIRHVCYPTSPR